MGLGEISLPKRTNGESREGRAPQGVLSFEDWIDHVGVDELAAILDVTRATVLHWKAGRCDPRVDHMRRIKRMTRGTIGYEQMIDRHLVLVERRRRNARRNGKAV